MNNLLADAPERTEHHSDMAARLRVRLETSIEANHVALQPYPESESRQLDPETVQKLKSLGYVE